MSRTLSVNLYVNLSGSYAWLRRWIISDKEGCYSILFGIRHSQYFDETSRGNLNACLVYTMVCGGQSANKSVFYPSHLSLLPNHPPRRDGRLCWSERETRTRILESGAREAPPSTTLLRAWLKRSIASLMIMEYFPHHRMHSSLLPCKRFRRVRFCTWARKFFLDEWLTAGNGCEFKCVFETNYRYQNDVK